MKTLKFLFACAFTLMAVIACTDKEDTSVNEGNKNDNVEVVDPVEEYYASIASISSESEYFTLADNGGTIVFHATGGVSVVVNVNCGAEWTFEVAETKAGADWLEADVDSNAGTLTITAETNAAYEAREAEITLLTAASKIEFATITVTQEGGAYISISTATLSFDENAGTETVSVESNYDWDYSYDATDWLGVERNGDNLTVSVSANDDSSWRRAIVTIIASDGAENTAEAELTITQSPASEKTLILTYSLTSADSEIILPLYGTVNCVVDWGDGTLEAVTEYQPAHTYATAGEYDVKIAGQVTALYSQTGISNAVKALLTAVKQWGNTGLTDMNYAFYYCTNLESVPGDTIGAFAEVTTFNQAFYWCAFSSLPEDLFAYCGKVTAFSNTFEQCKSLKSLPENLFANCTAVTSFGETFKTCTGLTTIPENLFSACVNVTSFGGTFSYCQGLTSIPSKLFEKNTKVTSFASVFQNCTACTTIPGGLFDNCKEVTSFYSAFYYWQKLESVPEGLFDNCTEVTTFRNVFYSCPALTSVPENLFDNCLKVTELNYAFYGCSKWTGESPYNLVDGSTKVHLYERADHTADLNCVAPTDYTACFANCTGLEDYDSIPDEWKQSGF